MVPESHPLAERESLTPQNLKDAPLLFPVRTPVHNLLLNWFGQYADQARANIAGYCSLTNNAVVMVTNGLGLFLGLDLGMCYPGVRAFRSPPHCRPARPSSGRNRPRPRRPPRNSPDSCWTEAYGPRIFSHGIEAWCRIPLLSPAQPGVGECGDEQHGGRDEHGTQEPSSEGMKVATTPNTATPIAPPTGGTC